MAIKSEPIQSTAEHDSSPDRKPVETPKVFDEPSFDLASEAILKATPPDPNAQAVALRRVRGETRERLMTQFQQSFGNRYIQRVMARVHSAGQSEDNLSQRIQSTSSSGDQLDAAVRNRLAASLGADLSNVHVHTDQEADRLSREVSAIAFTTGSHIFFREGAYQPDTLGGLRLIAHEATHTLQQASGPVDGTPRSDGVSISDPSDGFEQAAERAADGVMSGTVSSAPLTASGTQVQRQVPEEEEEEKLQLYRADAPMPAQRTATETIQAKHAPDISLQRWFDENGEWHEDVCEEGYPEPDASEPDISPPTTSSDEHVPDAGVPDASVPYTSPPPPEPEVEPVPLPGWLREQLYGQEPDKLIQGSPEDEERMYNPSPQVPTGPPSMTKPGGIRWENIDYAQPDPFPPPMQWGAPVMVE